ncbi:MAG TPA: glycosyltransferase family 39 protein [Lacipirellulaceae bacterium]|jgi:4-amino-4-deoxy-L-arabinose transferase-like glycosyltransferase|nr:glycosyltransferase family 39 protein [Lacipirellulaceae bacterium]
MKTVLATGAFATDQNVWSDLRAAALIIVAVSLIYGTRLSLEPLVGEETRWATSAREMLETGDWVVPRQQGHVFPERPPMTTWLMAIGGRLRGDVDPIAARLPSVIAIALTCLLIYGYTRAFAQSSTALIASLVYASSGQVLEIGRLGESEAVFALFVSASLLLWHLAYARRLRPLVVWTVGFSFAALAALVKGPQAPVYFGAITTAYLLVNRDLRYLFRWQVLAAALAFFAIIAAWQVPFYYKTDWPSVRAVWAGLAGDRFRWSGLLTHAASYPLETFACLLPWSPMLLALFSRNVRAELRSQPQLSRFLLTAIVVAYPTVWMAAAARGRYFMPLYPLVAVLIALIIECCSGPSAALGPRRAWCGFLVSWAVLIGAGAAMIATNVALPDKWSLRLYQPGWFALLFGLSATAIAYVIFTASVRRGAASIPVIALTCAAALGFAGLLLNINSARWNNPSAAVAEMAAHIPPGAPLSSLTEIEHRFAYYYGKPIAQLPWPQTVDDVPEDMDYFVFVRHWDDTARWHLAGRGRSYYNTPGTLPFEWEEITSLCPDRQPNTPTATFVVLGRVVRPLHVAVSDVSKPQTRIARQPGILIR